MSESGGVARSEAPVDGDGRLIALLHDAAAGRFPPSDGGVEVLPRPDGPCDAVVAFTAHHVIAADIDPEWVRSRLPADDLAAPMRPAFLIDVAQRLGTVAGMVDVVLAAIGVDGRSELMPERDDLDPAHPRVARARRYRRDVRCFGDGREGVVTLGHGLAGRVELSIELPEHAWGAGRGQALARAALALVAPGQPVFAQVSPGNAASLRCFLAAGFRPIGAEVLFRRDEDGSRA